MPDISSLSDEQLQSIVSGKQAALPPTIAQPTTPDISSLSDEDLEKIASASPSAPQGPLSNEPNEGWISGFEKGLGTAGVRGLSAAAGTPTLLGSFIDEGFNRLTSLATGKPLDQVRAQAAANRAKEPSLVTNTMPSDIENRIAQYTGSYEPTSAPGRIGQAAATGVVAGALLGPLGGEAAPLAVVPNAVGAGTSQAATEMGAGPVTSTIAGVAGGIGSEAALASQPARMLTQSGRQAVAGQKLIGAASDPVALKAAAATGSATTDQLVPGSAPTLFQATGDQGVGQLERAVRTADPTPFLERANQQQQAQVAAVKALPTGFSEDLASHLTDQLRASDARTEAMENLARQQAQTKAAGLSSGLQPEEQGAALRTPLADARAQAKAQENALWGAVDPDGTLVNTMTPVKAAANNIYGNLSRADLANLSPAENTFRTLISGYSDAEPFSELQGLKSNLGSAMRQELSTNGRSPAYGRMSQLMDGVYDTINNTIAQKIGQDESAVATGAIASRDATIAKLQSWQDAFYANKTAGEGTLTGSIGNAGRGPATVSSLRGTAGAPDQRLGNPPAGQGISSLTPNFDQAAADRLSLANQATKARATTFDQGPVGQVLAKGKTADTFKLQDSLVPGKVFKPGPTGGETIDAFRTATGATPQSESALQNAVTDSLYSKALGPDLTIDPGKFQGWVANHASALNRLDPAFVRSLADAPTATQTLNKIAAARKQGLDAYQKGAVGKLIGVDDPNTVQRVVGGIFGAKDGVQQMQRLAREAAKDTTGNATQGLRRAVVDHVEANYLKDVAKGNEQEVALKAAAFQGFVRKNADVLWQVFKPEEVNTFRAISQDIARSNQSITNKVPGPGTAQDILPHLRKAAEGAHGDTLIGGLWKAAIVGHELVEPVTGALGAHAAPVLAAGVLGKRAIQAVRNAGMAKVADLVKEGLLNPDLGRSLIMKASKVPDQGSQLSLANVLKRASVLAPVVQEQQVPQRASGGRIVDEVHFVRQMIPRGPSQRAAGGRVMPAWYKNALEKKANREQEQARLDHQKAWKSLEKLIGAGA